MLGGCLPLGFAILAGGSLVIGNVGGSRSQLTRWLSGSSEPTAIVAPDPAPVRDASKALTEAEQGPGIKFVSKWEGTQKLTARCADQTVRGKRRVFVPTEVELSCSVTAIHTDHTRRMAVISAAQLGAYRCFVDGVSECSPR